MYSLQFVYIYIYTSLYYNILYLLYIYICIIYTYNMCSVTSRFFLWDHKRGSSQAPASGEMNCRASQALGTRVPPGSVGWRDLDPSWEYQWNTNGIPIEIMQPMVLEYLPIHLPQKSTSFVGKYSSTSIWVYNLSIFITFYCRNQPVLHEMGTCFFFFGFIGS